MCEGGRKSEQQPVRNDNAHKQQPAQPQDTRDSNDEAPPEIKEAAEKGQQKRPGEEVQAREQDPERNKEAEREMGESVFTSVRKFSTLLTSWDDA